MCYRDNVSPLHFDGVHVASLCGNNGSGKSALLDAMTWALWGQARAKSDDDLIHMGQTDMEVEFEFYVGSDKYKVLRKRSKSRTSSVGHTLLEFQQAVNGGFRSITGNSIRETQRKIIDTLRMDYQTFINSAFLLQGRSDEFTIKLPSERKKVLSEILGLSFYDELENRAKERAKNKKIDVAKFESSIEDIVHELVQKKEYQNSFQVMTATLNDVDKEVARQYGDNNALRKAMEAMEYKRKQLSDITARMTMANRQLNDLAIQLKFHQDRIKKYEGIVAGYDSQLAGIKNKINDIEKSTRDLLVKKQKQEELSNTIHHLTTVNMQLKREMGELKAKIELLNKETVDCPLCGTELGEMGRKRIINSYQAQGEAKGDNYRVNDKLAVKAEADLAILKKEVTELESKVADEKILWEKRQGLLEKDYLEATDSLPVEKEAFERIQDAIARWQKAIDEDNVNKDQLSADLVSIKEIEEKIFCAEAEYKKMLDYQRDLRDKLITVQERLRHFNEIDQIRIQKQEALDLALNEKSIYDELSIAFGKKGIQALIIEKALPEIEVEANRLLARMTDNRMHVRLESQRTKKTNKEEIEETLDIKISDELGTRNYELFSGGEAFRINFALRIALSKLLARRHGAPLRTLVIDEGFGTQDSMGTEKIIEAINSIQDDFEKILVVTHIEELREVFPVRIQVVKTDVGSLVNII